MSLKGDQTWNIVALRKTLDTSFSINELQELMFDLGIDYEALSGDTKQGKTREIIEYFSRRERLDELVSYIQKLRPTVDVERLLLPESSAPTSGSPAAPPMVAPSEAIPIPPASLPETLIPSAPPPPKYPADFVDFVIALDGTNNEIGVKVLNSPAGYAETRRPFRLTRETAINAGLAELDKPLFNREVVQHMGARLKDLLLKDEVGKVFEATLARATSRGTGVRFRLRVATPELRRLPWEYLYDKEQHQFLSLSGVVFSRYPAVAHALSLLPGSTTLRVLLVLSSPRNLPMIDLIAEQKRILDALGPLMTTQRITLDILENPTPRNIRQQLRRSVYHVVHYSGYIGYSRAGEMTPSPSEGSGGGYIVLPDDDGQALYLNEESFALFFTDYYDMRLVILNAASQAYTTPTVRLSGLGDQLAQSAGLPAVIAMQFPIADQPARVFYAYFYTAIVDGVPLDVAVSHGRNALMLQFGVDERAWGTPVLYMTGDYSRLLSQMAS